MKKNILWLLLLMVAAACGGDSGGDTPEINKDYLSVAPNMEFGSDALTTELTIDANCSWTITKDADWLTVSPMSGTGKQSVTVTVSKNPANAERTAVLSVKGGSLPVRYVTVTQAKSADATPETPTVTASPSELNFESEASTQTISVVSNTSWTVVCPSWVSVSPSSGSNNGTVTVTAEENTGKEPRTGQITISASGVSPVIISVSQKAAEASTMPGADDNQPPS